MDNICFYCNGIGYSVTVYHDLSINICHWCLNKLCYGCLEKCISSWLYCKSCQAKKYILCNKCLMNCLHHCNIPIKNKYMNINVL